MNQKSEFQNYATKHLGLNSLTTEDVIKHQIRASMTPMIVEEREMRVTLISVFDRLMSERILWVASEIEERMASVIQAQLMYLDSVENRDITIHISSPGGSVVAGLSIIDMMNWVKSDIKTINTGMCASMGSVILSAGQPGKRLSLINSKVMTHMVSHGMSGNVQDTRISQIEAEKYNYILFKMLAKNCGKTFEEIYEISRHDKWFTSSESLRFGLIDEIIGVSEDNNIDKMLEGFDLYYNKEVLGK
jgi:ATP-dependent Clp protease protease subunit